VKEGELEVYIASLEQVKEETESGSKGDKDGEPEDAREPYRGRGVLQEPAGREHIFMMDQDGTDVIQLTESTGFEAYPRFSPLASSST